MGTRGGPFGPGTPVSATPRPTVGLAGVRYLNPASKSYQKDPKTGQLAQMPAVRQRVLIAVTTRRGSSTALPDMGIKLPPKMGNTFEAEVTASVRDALRQLTDVEKLARITSITTTKGSGGRAQIDLSYIDLTTGLPDQLTI